jgi:hypothetical protein
MLLNDPDRAQLGLEHGPEGLGERVEVEPIPYRVALIRNRLGQSSRPSAPTSRSRSRGH